MNRDLRRFFRLRNSTHSVYDPCCYAYKNVPLVSCTFARELNVTGRYFDPFLNTRVYIQVGCSRTKVSDARRMYVCNTVHLTAFILYYQSNRSFETETEDKSIFVIGFACVNGGSIPAVPSRGPKFDLIPLIFG